MSRLGWRGPGVPDQRDVKFAYHRTFDRVDAPMVKDLIIGPIVDQAELGSCGAFAATSNMVSTGEQNTGNPLNLSQLWLYYRYRERFGHVEYDDGVFLRDLIKVLASDGVPLESDWPYILANWDKRPPPESYARALPNRITSYHALYTLDDMVQNIASGYAFFGGISWHESADSLYTERTGHIELPNGKLLGGHALVFTSYNLHTKQFGGPNSWSTAWGDKGKFTIDFEYLTDQLLAGDFWTVRG